MPYNLKRSQMCFGGGIIEIGGQLLEKIQKLQARTSVHKDVCKLAKV